MLVQLQMKLWIWVFKMKFEKVDDHVEFEQKNNANPVLFVPHF